MYQELKEAAYLANMTIARSGLIPVDPPGEMPASVTGRPELWPSNLPG